MASQNHQIKNKPSSSRASVGSRDLVPVSRGGCNHRSTASSGKLQSQGRSSTSTQINQSNKSNAHTICKEEHRKQSVQIYSSGKKSTTKVSSSEQMVERISSSSRGSQTTTKISSSKQREATVTASGTHIKTQTRVKEEKMIKHKHGSVVIDMHSCSEMQYEKTKKNMSSPRGNVAQGEKFRIGGELKLKIKY